MILVNGAPDSAVSAADRGLCYGDGVFRTLAVRAQRIARWARQYARLAADCAVLGIACPDEALLRREVHAVADAQADCAVRVTVTRGIGRRGYAPPRPARPTRIVAGAPLPAHPPHYATGGVRVHLCRIRLGFQPVLAGVKHLNRLENVLARMEWADAGIAEGLLFDAEDNVIEATACNVFVVERGTLLTPDLSRCGVAGVTRDRILEGAAGLGLGCRVESVSRERLFAADELLLVNSLIGLWPVRSAGDRAWTPGPVAARLRQWLLDDEARETA
jgi:4-amino-4-deoxychorismate lyase